MLYFLNYTNQNRYIIQNEDFLKSIVSYGSMIYLGLLYNAFGKHSPGIFTLWILGHCKPRVNRILHYPKNADPVTYNIQLYLVIN